MPAKTPLELLADETDKNRRAQTAAVEIVTEADVSAAELTSLAANIEKSIDLVANHEDAFEEATLEHRLEIGLHIAKAMEVFTLSNQDRAMMGGDAKAALSRRDKAEDEAPAVPVGFSAWLKTHVKRLKRPVAYKYAAAFRSLALPPDAKPGDIKARLKTLRHEAGKAKLPMPTLAALVKAAPKPPKTTLVIEAPKDSKQLRLEDARETLQNWKDAWDQFVQSGQLDDLQKRDIEALKEFQLGIGDQIKARLR